MMIAEEEQVMEASSITETIGAVPFEEHGDDGPRARHLKQALRKALTNTIKSCR